MPMDQTAALRVFMRIAESGSFTRAAHLSNVPKATVTRHIQELEAHLGVKLLQRTTRRVTLTAEGAAYYERAVHLIADLDDMDEQAANARARPQGRLRVEVGSSLANFVLIPALRGFRQRYPDVQIDLGVSDRPSDLVKDGVDCVIRGGALPDSSLVARRVAQVGFVTCASPAYVRQYGQPAHPDDIERRHVPVHYLSSVSGRPFPMRFHRGSEAIEVTAAVGVSVNESTAHLSALRAGLGLGQTFEYMVAPHIATGELVPLLTDWTRPRYPISVLYPSTRYLSAKLRLFVDWTAEVFGELAAPAD